MELLTAIIGGIFVSLIAAEIIANVPRISKWLIQGAVLRLPDHTRDRYREEWLAHLDEIPGTFGKLRHASGCRLKARVVRATLTEPDLEMLEKLVKYGIRIRMLPALLPMLVRGQFKSVKLSISFIDRLIHQRIVCKYKRKMNDAQLEAMSREWVGNIKRFFDDPKYRDELIEAHRKKTTIAEAPSDKANT